MINMNDHIVTLRSAGITNPKRLIKLIKETISKHQLDLTGLTVLTEAASGPYMVTPVIAALAGAKRVIALTRDSQYGSFELVTQQTRALEELCGLTKKIDIYTQRKQEAFAEADIITNLGFVRPIDKNVIDVMQSTAVIPLMCEAWEFRPGDLDLEACSAKGVLVLATDEDASEVDVFSYSGWLCQKMIFDAQIEVYKSKYLVVGTDKFSKVIHHHLRKLDLCVTKVEYLNEITPRQLQDIDVLIVADYTREDVIIGCGGDISCEEIAANAPELTIINFAGKCDVDELTRLGLYIYPERNITAHQMGITLAGIGPRPVVELHTAGLKIGQVASRARKILGLDVADAIEHALTNSPAQVI